MGGFVENAIKIHPVVSIALADLPISGNASGLIGTG
jgi:hypothetical protein